MMHRTPIRIAAFGARATAAAAVCLAASVRIAAAQGTTVPPQAPSEPPIPASPTEVLVPGVAVPLTTGGVWTLALNAGGHWNSNLRLSTVPEGAFSERVGLQVTRAKRTGRGTLALSLDAYGALYNEETSLSTGGFSGASSGTYELSPRTTFRGGVSAGTSYAPESEALAAEGLLLPFSRAVTSSVTAGLSRRLTRRASVNADVRYNRADFFEAPGEATQPVDGSGVHVSGALGTAVGPNDNLSLGYELQRTDAGLGGQGNTHSGTLGWTRTIGTRYRLNAAAGGSRYELAGSGSQGWAVRTLAGVSAQFRRSLLSGRFDRGITPAFGLGRDRLSDVVGLSYSVSSGRDVQFGVDGTYGLSRDPQDDLFRRTSQSAGARLMYLVTRRLGLSTSYEYRRAAAEEGPTVSGHSFDVALGFSREWRR